MADPKVEVQDDGSYLVAYPDHHVIVGASQADNEKDALAVAEPQHAEYVERQKELNGQGS